jgi:vacuolar-type H+-ATPase subunit I/STV1
VPHTRRKTLSDDAPKSALELAMARFRKQDEDEGVETRTLSEEQKAGIAEAKRVAEAKLAEREILHQAALRRVEDPESRGVLEDQYRRDRERVLADRDRKIAGIRGA